MSFEEIVQYLLSGITCGSIYAIVATGYNIIYNTTGIINFAQGEFVMLGGMSAVSFAAFMPLPAAIACAVIVTAFSGIIIDMAVIRRLKKPSVINMVIVTIGLSIVIREIALHIWDEKVRSLACFTGSEISSVNIFGAYISPQVFWVLGACFLIVVCLGIFFRFSLWGRSMRACSSNTIAARLCGINSKNMVTLSFALSAGIGALAGCVISPITLTQYDCGSPLAIKGFAAAILGGLGNSYGAVAGGLLIGVIEALSISVIPLAYKDAVSIAVLLVILFLKPSGIFGSKEISALKEF